MPFPLSEHLYFHSKFQPCHPENFSLYRISPFCDGKKKLKKISITNTTLFKRKFNHRKGENKNLQKNHYNCLQHEKGA
jgi:hypothetical protein